MANAPRYKPRLIASAFRGEHPARAQAQLPAPFLALLIPQKSHLSALPATASPPTIPPGERRALPAPAQGSKPLRIPFWGAAAVSPQPPSPKTPQAAGPCSWACRSLFPPPPHLERNEARPPPARGAGVRRIRANGTGCRHRRPAGGKSLLVDLPPCMRSAAGQKRNEARPPPAHGADLRDQRANGTGRRHCRPIGRRLFRRRGRRRSFAGTPQSPSRPRGRARG